MQQILREDLSNYIGKEIMLSYNERTEIVSLVSVQEKTFSAKIKRNDKWDGIEPFFYIPENDDDFKIFTNEP